MQQDLCLARLSTDKMQIRLKCIYFYWQFVKFR